MNSSNPFDHDSLMYKLMKYLYKIQEQMETVPYVWILIDVVQFMTIATSLLGYVIKVHYNIVQQDLFSNFLNIFLNYSQIYDWLVISGASSAFIVLVALLIYVVMEFRMEIKENTKKKLLNYCALTGTISIGLFQFFSQVMANNLINIVSKIFNNELEMNVILIGCFLLNMAMMIFVSIFNADKRIFRFSLVLVSLGLNIMAFTLTCIMLIALSIYYQYLDKVVYKKLFYMLIIAICLWCSLEVNDTHQYQLTSRELYLAMTGVAILVYYLHYDHEFLNTTFMEENQYLVELYKKRLRKQDKNQDYLLADQFFTRYFCKERQKINIFSKNIDCQFFLTSSVEDWSQTDFKQRIIQKIKTQRLQADNENSLKSQIQYFNLLLQLKINMVQLLQEVFMFMSQKRNQNLKVIYQINKLTHKIQHEFSKIPNMDDNILKLEQIIELEEMYTKFYRHYVAIVNLLEEIFESINIKNGQITQNIEEKLTQFTLEQNLLEKTLKEITSITGPKLQSKLYAILADIWGKYQKGNYSSHHLQNSQQYEKLPHQQSKQKFNFSYIVISNKTIKYASIKFLSNYSYKESYITSESMGLIFPNKFSLFVTDLIEKNAGNKVFVSQLPILNQKGMFEIVNATFYLIPEFKGEITYIVQFRKIPQFQSKSLFLFNSETLCIECFNKRMIQKFKLSLQKINGLLQTGAIQFSNLFVFGNDEKIFLHFTSKQSGPTTRINKRVVLQNHSHTASQKFSKENDKPSSVKALMKMDYLSELKKATGKNVTLEPEMSFDISNINYKLIKLDDASTNKHNQGSVMNDRTNEINFYREINKTNQSQFQNSTKDLKKKYKDQEFFCPISNPYTPRILQKLNMINSSNQVNNLTLIKIIYSVGLLFLFFGMMGFKISTEQFSTEILQFQKFAHSINKQYSYFMTGVLRAYELHNIGANSELFISYIQKAMGLSQTDARQFHNKAQNYVYEQKKAIIKKCQDAYFDYPIIFDTETIPIQIFTDLFVLNSTSKTTLIYDIVVFLLQSQNYEMKKTIAYNFNIYETMAKILRPDGRYDSKIQSLDNDPGYIVIAAGFVMVVCFGLVYYCLYQLRQARQDIILIYKYIEKKEIYAYMRKIQEIQELIEILSNNKKTAVEESPKLKQSGGIFSTVSEFNSANNLKSERFMNENDSVKTSEFEGKSQGENQSDELLGFPQGQEKRPKILRKNFKSQSKMSIFIETILKYPIHFLFMLLNCAILFYAYDEAHTEAENYIKAFRYFEKIRAVNFQSRYLYVMSQSNAFYSSVLGIPYEQSDIKEFMVKMTHFSYEKPEQFLLENQQNLCSQQSVSQITDPFLSVINCDIVDDSILTQDFSQAYEQYEKDLRTISTKTYEQLMSQPQNQKNYFNTMYEYFIFGNYLDKIADQNFSDNITIMGENVKNTLLYIFFGSVAWTLLSLGFVFLMTFPKIETELATVISLIKMIPPQTLFSMKVAALFKKRNILQKLNNL